MRLALAAFVVTLLFACARLHAGTINIALVPVGDPGNVADPLTGYGAVSYSYSIGEYNVTMGQYAAFLNSVATTGDPYGLYNTGMATATPTYGITRTSTRRRFSYAAEGNSANVPVTYVNWGDAVRFVQLAAERRTDRPRRARHDGNGQLCAERQHRQRGASRQ